MKIMLDTNILISTALFPRGAAARAFQKSLMPPFEPVVCDYIIDELRRKFREKFSNRTASLETFMDRVLPHIGIVPTHGNGDWKNKTSATSRTGRFFVPLSTPMWISCSPATKTSWKPPFQG